MQTSRVHIEQGLQATMCVRDYEFKVPYGVIHAEGHCITSIIEKPVHKFFINAGIYVLNPVVLKMINGKEYLDMPDLFSELINEGKQASMFPLYEYWLDIGKINQFNQAQIDLKDFF